ncbi:MAG: alpha/beta hydrolase [Christensenellaceae bacterium]|nr:alpha/beta hydrolase [Christensenellaceae bacterium]
MEIIRLYSKEEYPYKTPGDFIPQMTLYMHDDEKIRPAMVVIPGGGYGVVSPTEAVLIAEKFRDLGYNAFVVTYTVRVDEKLDPLMRQPIADISRAIRLLRSEPERFKIDPEKISVVGFSAGGHLAGSMAVHADEDGIPGGISARPNAAILSYPVISAGDFAHRGSFDNLIGKNPTDELMQWASLETQVDENTCPCFLWHTFEDTLVPPENSLLFERALAEKNIMREMHIFATGHHGQSLATQFWKDGNYYYEDVMAQYEAMIAYELEHHEGYGENLPFKMEDIKDAKEGAALFAKNVMPGPDAQVNESLQIWPILADNFLKRVYMKK